MYYLYTCTGVQVPLRARATASNTRTSIQMLWAAPMPQQLPKPPQQQQQQWWWQQQVGAEVVRPKAYQRCASTARARGGFTEAAHDGRFLTRPSCAASVNLSSKLTVSAHDSPQASQQVHNTVSLFYISCIFCIHLVVRSPCQPPTRCRLPRDWSTARRERHRSHICPWWNLPKAFEISL